MVEGLASKVTLPEAASRRRRLVTQADSGPAMGHSVTSNLTLHQREGSSRPGELGLGLASPIGHRRANFTARAPVTLLMGRPQANLVHVQIWIQPVRPTPSECCKLHTVTFLLQLHCQETPQSLPLPEAPVIALRDKRV